MAVEMQDILGRNPTQVNPSKAKVNNNLTDVTRLNFFEEARAASFLKYYY